MLYGLASLVKNRSTFCLSMLVMQSKYIIYYIIIGLIK